MASIAKDPNGKKRIQFVTPEGRKSLRLGKCSMRQAEAFKVKFENLVSGRLAGGLDDETARWLANLPDEMHARLSKLGLVKPKTSMRLGEFLEEYIAGRTDAKQSTKTSWGHVQRNLLDFFGPDRPLRDISEGSADQWRIYLTEQDLADNTVRRRTGIAKQFCRAAIRQRLILSNPFEHLVSATHGNRDKYRFVTLLETQQILEACPNSQWRAIVAMTRFGGLRCPSEILLAEWQDVDWERGKLLVHSPKTEHHPGGKTRYTPLFPELREILLETFDQAQEGDKHIIVRYRSQTANLRTHFMRIIRKAGLEPWPKLFQNIRSSRETELVERWPVHVVCSWLGNSPAVAHKHYLQTTDEHFEQAINPVQNEAQQGARKLSHRVASENTETHKPIEMQELAGSCEGVRNVKMVVEGLELFTEPVRKAGVDPLDGLAIVSTTEGGATAARTVGHHHGETLVTSPRP